MIVPTINQKIADALRAHDEIRLSTLRMLSSALNYEFIAKQHKLNEEEEIVVVKKEAKKRKDAIEAYISVGAKDRADKEQKELEILQEFLPPEMPEGELIKIIDETIASMGVSTIAEIGKLIGAVKARTGGKAEGGKIAEIVKNKLGV